ncbi:hypothetical protein SDC9_73306 [bioreactor metagenome]|uniref:Uncharacterized protein n=1 Tax=bioreactor metagenome TaxID=1076179 RepID=A0A644YFX9_9ZZZZ
MNPRPQNLLQLRTVAVQTDVKAPVVVHIPQGQRHVAQHGEFSPQGHFQQVSKIVLNLGIAGFLVRLLHPPDVLKTKPLGEHMDGADDKIQLRHTREQPLRPGLVHLRVSQLQPQPQFHRAGPAGGSLGIFRRQRSPVKFLQRDDRAGLHRLKVVGKAEFVQSRFRGGGGHFQHRRGAVGGDAGMGVVIGQIHGAPHFLYFLKNFLRSS